MIYSGFLSAQDRKDLLGCIKRHTEEHGVARRANALLLLDDGLSFAQVAKVFYLDDDTVRGWYKQYQTGGWDLVASNDWQGGQSRMTAAQEATLIAWLEGRVCRSVAEVRAYILAEFGIHYAHSGCVKLMARLGFEYRKPRAVPRVADPEDQAAFIAFYTGLIKYLQPDEAVYFADAVHPEHQSKPAFGWFKKGVKSCCKYNLRAWPRQCSRRAEPRKLRHTLCRTRYRQWRQRSAAFGQNRGPQQKETQDLRDLGQRRISQKRGGPRLPIPPQKPHPPHQTAALLPASKPD